VVRCRPHRESPSGRRSPGPGECRCP
jgi:hypothetical protein